MDQELRTKDEATKDEMTMSFISTPPQFTVQSPKFQVSSHAATTNYEPRTSQSAGYSSQFLVIRLGKGQLGTPNQELGTKNQQP